MLDGFFWEYPVLTLARGFEPEVLSDVPDEGDDWVHTLIGDKNSNVQFWVDITRGYWEFNQVVFDRTNPRDRFLEKFYSCEDVILEIDSLVNKLEVVA